MDYDDNDFQSQNLRLAGEGSAKFPPVLGPYALPKFDFDDSLQGHLRFDSLVETEVFLGIESQEDNQWIEDFSRGSSGIEFSSSAAESCSISRRNNVWSEATSSESVEMLLKSVGQEEIVPGQTTVKDSGACDELGSITKQMEHNLKPDNSNLSNVGNVIDSGPTIRPDEFLGSFSVLNKDAGKELPQIEDTSQTREGDSLAYRSSTDLPVTEGNMLIDSKDDDANQGEIDTLVNESLNNNTQDDFSASGMQVDNIITSMHNVITSAEELNNQKAPPDHINDISHGSGDALSKDNDVDGEEHNVLSKEDQMNDKVLEGNLVDSGAGNLEHPLYLDSEESRGEGNAVETCTSNVEGPSSTIVKSDSELNVVEGCSEGVKESVQESKCEVVLSKDAEMVDQFTVNMHGGSPIASKGESSFSGHAVEVSNRNAENCAILEQKMDSHVQLTYEKSSFVKKKDDLLESGNQLNSEISTSHLDTSLLSEETNKLSEGNCDGSGSHHEGDISSKLVVSSSAELCGESHTTENVKCANVAFGVHGEDLNAGDHVPISTPSESIQIRIQNAVSRQSGIHNFDSDVPVVEEGNVKLSTDLSNMEHEIGGSLPIGECSKENEVVVPRLQSDAASRNEPAPGVVLKDTDLASHETLDGSSLPSGLGVSTVDSFVHKEDGKPPSLIVGLTHLDRKEEVADGGSVEVSLSAGIEHSQVGSKTVSASDEKDACCDTAGERPSETIDSSLPMMEISNAVSQNEPQAMITDKDDQESKKLEVCPVLCDSTVKEGDGAEAVLVKISEEATTKEGFDEASLKVTDVEISRKGHMLTPPVPFSLEGSCSDIGQKVQEENGAPSVSGDKRQQTAVSSTGSDALNGHEGSFSAVSVSEHDAKLHVTEGGKNNADSDKPNCGSPTVISCIDLPQSEKESQEGVRSAVGQNVPVPEIIDGVPVKGSSMSQDPKEDDSSKDERSFSFEVGALADLSEREAGKCWQPFSTQACKTSVIVEGSPSTSVLGQMDPKMAQEISRGSPRASGGIASGSSKGTERKTKRASGKATGKETAKKGSNVKDTAHARQPPERVDKSGNLSPIPSGATQYVQSKEMQHTGNMERSSTKSCGTLTTPTSNLPDLNTSASPSAIFQQPFTDLQQVQLRAQIFVYGSLIQGTAPDEACMASAFGTPDGGRSLWENAWHASVERLQGQKSHPSNPETPLQSRSGARTPDQASIQQGALQGKVIPSPVGRASSKGTPSTIVNPMMPLPSPLWSISTQGDVMQSSGLPRGGLMDHHPALSPLHPYQTPPVRNFVGHNTSWISQPTFPGPWVPSQTSGLDASVRFPALPVTETVKLTPVRESTVPHSSSVKHVSSGPMGHSGGPTSVFAGTSPLLDAKKATASPGQPSTDPKPRKRKKTPASEGPSQISLPSQSQTEPIPVVTSHFSTSVSITTPASLVSKSNTGKLVAAASPTFLSDQMKLGSRDAEQRSMLTEETLGKVKEAKLQAEDAAALAAAAVSHSQGVWSELDKQKNSGLISDVQAKIASAAVAIAAAASVAKAAAAAARIASNAALQAKLMVDEALVSSANIHPGQSSDGVSILGKATPASILKGDDGTNCSSSILVAAREAARRRVEAASAASKRAENLDAIVKAAELAAEAVSQAGKIVAMGDPLPLSELVEAGPEGYWKASQVLSEPVVRLNNTNRVQADNNVEEGPDKHPKVTPSDKKETHMVNHGKPLTRREMSRELVEDHTRLVDGMPSSVTSSEKDSRGQKGRKVSDLAKTIGVVPESEVGSRSNSIAVQNEYERTTENLKENSIKEGSLVEVFKDGDGSKAAWFSANVLSLKDQKAYVCYVELPSDEGSGQLKEWVALASEGDKPPRIRFAHPMTAIQFEGTRKRRRAAIGDYAWSVGDRVDVWVQNCWCEGVVTEKSRKDETMLTVRISAQGETSVVRAWHLRPSLIWKDGEWIEWSSSRENDHTVHEGDTPQEKRLKLGSPAVEAKGKDKMSKNIDAVDNEKPEEPGLLALSGNDKIFNVGKNTRDENKPDAPRMIRTGLQKEGSRVIFGVPKPGKKRKFMEVSKHYVADRSNKISEANDSVKFAKYLIPQGSGPRGWKNTSKIDSKEKRAVESKPKVIRSGKPQNVSSRTVPRKDNLLASGTSASNDTNVTDNLPNIKDSVSHDENASGKQNVIEFESFSNTEGQAEGPILFSSLPLPSDAPSSKKMPVSNVKSQRVSKGKLAPSGGKLAKIEEEKVYNGNPGKSVPEAVEPRRSNRRIQPTSRLLEGLQSSLIISKIPSVSHDKGHKSQNRSASRGNNHG